METVTEIKSWGNSLGLRITNAMASEPMFTKNTKVIVTSTPEGMTIKPVETKRKYEMPFTESELISGLNEYNAHTDELAGLLPCEIMDY
ncbi:MULTISPECIES: hypothetical protein [unclassified Pseudoalteromonas]|uniref:AbrB/MazE/SpoVT family DNA-binding domain-containing protein n=1 Tax=unclassified Pseudoalteromonas TaxID=194690 RepID=UPI001408A316|nr:MULTISPECIES: hypothetical protein [unclassified Pseudoalteromonas]MBH0027559.1 hypothetical protein [Pseudoalteromonas sp. SWN29]